MAGAATLVLALGACGTEDAGGGAEPVGSPSDIAPTEPAVTDPGPTEPAEVCEPPGEELPEVDIAPGGSPALTWPDGCAPDGLIVEVLTEGDGEAVEPGAAVAANYQGSVWGSQTPFDSSFERGGPRMFSLNGVINGWSTGIPGTTVGSRLLLSIPPDQGYGDEGLAQAGIAGNDTLVFVIDVEEAFNPDDTIPADAADVAPADLPVTVDGAIGEPASVVVPEGAAEPTQTEVIVLAEGSGEPLQAGSFAAVWYAVTSWDGSLTESFWEATDDGVAGPMVAQLGAGTIFDPLVDVPVGSRVLILTPAMQMSPALAVVVDVLGTL